MLKNYLLVAFRQLIRKPMYSLINIGGLTLGLTACLLILLFVKDELSFDSWIPEVDSLYRQEITFYPPGRAPIGSAQIPGPFKAAYDEYFPNEILETTRMFEDGGTIIIGENEFSESIFMVDANFFDVFDLPMVAGNRERALADAKSILITEEIASKFFGSEAAIGKTFEVDNGAFKLDYEVVGILQDLPEQTHLDIDMVALFDQQRYAEMPWIAEQWASTNMWAYAKLAHGVTPESILSRQDDFLDRYVDFGIPGLEEVTPSTIIDIHLLPVLDIHLKSPRQGEMRLAGDIGVVYAFSGVALLILIIASINFTNLATARSMQRAREVSLRKVVGAARSQLIGQFLGESVLLTVLALVVAVILTVIALPYYNDFLGRELTLLSSDQIGSIGQILLLAVFIGVFGGIYPAFYLSRFRPAHILRSNQSSANGTNAFRNALVILQFAISIGLVVSTATIYQQTRYARTMDLGYDKEHKLSFRGMLTTEVKNVAQTFHDEIMKIPGITGATFASDSFPQRSSNNTLVEIPGVETEGLLVIETMTVAMDFFQLFNVKPLAGRLFSEEFRADLRINPEEGSEEQVTNSIIINQASLRFLGLASAEQAVGMEVLTTIATDSDNPIKALSTIVGVIPDLHTRTIREKVTPFLYYVTEAPANILIVDVQSTDLSATLAQIDALWSSLMPTQPIRRSFVEENFDGLYQGEEDRAQMFAGFSGFAILVASLGLYGLASYAAERRTKEIGIRKVMGASSSDLVRMLVWQFSRPVLLANLIAWPVAWYFMNDWLQGFEYRMDLSPLLFLGAGVAALIIAWTTVGGHAYMVARTAPVTSLRYE